MKKIPFSIIIVQDILTYFDIVLCPCVYIILKYYFVLFCFAIIVLLGHLTHLNSHSAYDSLYGFFFFKLGNYSVLYFKESIAA